MAFEMNSRNHSSFFIEDPLCNCSHYKNLTFMFFENFGFIPETLAINVCSWAILLFLFALLRKNAWNYGRIALVQKNDQKWTQLFYGEIENVQGSGLLQHQDSVDSMDVFIRIDQGFCSWLAAIFKIKDDHILKKNGPDAIQYLTFQRYIIVYLAIICLISLTIILPINFQGDKESIATSFGFTTISNLKATSSLLWIHVTFAFLFFPLGIYFMRHFSVNLKWDEEYNTISRTLMITHIPTIHCSQNKILQHFRESYPECVIEDIQFAFNISDLMRLDQNRQAAHEARLWCENYFKEKNIRLQMRPYNCGCLLSCCTCCTSGESCQKVDSIEFYTSEEKKLTLDMEQEKQSALRKPLGIVFITFQTRNMANSIYKDHQTSCKCGHDPPTSSLTRDLEPLAWEVYYAQPPEDIYWENLSSNTDNWYLRAILVNSILFLVLFFLTTPAIIVKQINLIWFQTKIENINPLLSEFVPTLMMWLVAALLPVIVSYSDQFLYHWTRSGENHTIMRKTFLFLLFMVIILPSLGLPSAEEFVQWAVNRNDTKCQWECVFVPDNGAFFVNYVITSAFIGTALELIRFPELFMYTLRLMCARSPAEQARVRKNILWQFSFGTQYAWMLLNVGVTVIYSIPYPLISLFGLVYICMKHCVDRYNIYFAYGPSKINKKIHITAINFVIIEIIILQIVILSFLSIGLGTERNYNIVWISFSGCCISIILFVGQMFFKLFQRFSPVHKGQSEILICDDASLSHDYQSSEGELHEASSPKMKFIPSVLRSNENKDDYVFSVHSGQQRSYGTSNGNISPENQDRQ